MSSGLLKRIRDRKVLRALFKGRMPRDRAEELLGRDLTEEEQRRLSRNTRRNKYQGDSREAPVDDF